MRLTLIHPPDGMLPAVPYASMGTLTSCLAAHGHEVTVRDLSLESIRRLLKREQLEGWYDLVEGYVSRLSARAQLDDADRRELWRLQRLLAIPRDTFKDVEESLALMQDIDSFLQPERFNRAFDVLRTAQRFVMTVGQSNYTEPHRGAASILDAREHELPDPVIDLFGEFADDILAGDPEILAVTVPYDPSIFYGLKLMRELKQRAPNLPIIVGGAGIESYLYPIIKDPAYFAVFDYAMVGEGEEQFPRLVDVLQEGGDPRTVNNMRWLAEDGTIGESETVMVTDLNAVPSPDFSRLPIHDYLLPDPVATFQTSRGCYYGKCAFCSEIFRKGFRMRRPDLVVDDMVKIYEKSGIRHFQLWDSLAPPKTLRKVAEAIRDRGLPFEWMAETKFEKPYLDERMVETLAQGGCTFLLFGFESGSSRVLDLIDKGNNIESVDRIMALLTKHGIRTGTSWFIGFPGEEEIDADTTFDFIASRRDLITFNNYVGTFGVGTDTIVYENQERFGVEIFETEDGALDFRHRDGTPHWDCAERDFANFSRGDLHQVKTHVELHYAKVPPETALLITGQSRLGLLLRHVVPDQLHHVRFQATAECKVRRYDRHPHHDDAQGVAVAYHMITGHVFELAPDSLMLLEVLQQPRTVAELVAATGWTEEELATRVELGVNRGLIRILADPDQLRWLPQAERRQAVSV